MPAKSTLIPSAPLRSAVIGGLMMALLAGSMGLAWGLTGAPALPPQTPEPNRFVIGDVSVAIPSAWQLESVFTDANKQPRGCYFVNAVSPAERLRIERYELPQAVEPEQVLFSLFYTQSLVAGLNFNPTNMELPPYSLTSGQDGEMLGTFFPTERNAKVQTSPQLHAVRLFTPDRKRYWLFHLIDQVPRENYTALEAGHREQLRRIVETLEYAPQAEATP